MLRRGRYRYPVHKRGSIDHAASRLTVTDHSGVVVFHRGITEQSLEFKIYDGTRRIALANAVAFGSSVRNFARENPRAHFGRNGKVEIQSEALATPTDSDRS